MKILITTDPEIEVPPKYYGGAERIANWLSCGLVGLGHDVVLLANPGSTINVRKYGWPKLHSRGLYNSVVNGIKLLQTILKERPAVIISFSRIVYFYPSLLVPGLRIVKRYGRFVSPKSTALANAIFGNRIRYVVLAKHMMKHLPFVDKISVIPNCVDTEYFCDDAERKKEYLIFLGRVEHIKGVREAIEIALATDTPLVIAGNIPAGHEDYFDQNVKPFLINPLIRFVGPVDDNKKRYYLQGAIALLFPINLEIEAFGIVLIESLACGTPVIGRNIAAVPEIITDNENGFVCSDVGEMITKVPLMKSLNRMQIRKNAVENYSIPVISARYSQLLSKDNIS